MLLSIFYGWMGNERTNDSTVGTLNGSANATRLDSNRFATGFFSVCVVLILIGSACRTHRSNVNEMQGIAITSAANQHRELPVAAKHFILEGLPENWNLLPEAAVLEIYDTWSGENPAFMHKTFFRLERQRNRFSVRAKLVPYGVLGERVFDPTAPAPTNGKPPCICAIEQTCACESTGVTRHTGLVASSVVETFLKFLAHYGIDPHGSLREKSHPHSWSDDYPSAHLVIWTDRRSLTNI